MGRKKYKLNQFENSAWLNNMTFVQYQNRLTELAVSTFEWKGLPDTVDSRYIELELFMNGRAVYFNDDVLGNLCLSMVGNGPFDFYGDPVIRRAYSKYNNFQDLLNPKNSVIIYNNQLRTNSVLDVQMFAYRLYNCDRIIDVNLNGQKTPVMVTSNEQQRLTMQNLYKEYDGNEPFIFGDKNIDLSGIKVLKTDAPFVADKVRAEKVEIWNEALTYLGIPNTNIQKKSRVVTDEVKRSQGGTLACLNARLAPRQKAAKKISEMFHKDITVDLSDVIKAEYQSMENNDLELSEKQLEDKYNE